MRITVLGAAGGIGRALAEELAGRGHEVTAASRSISPAGHPAGVRAVTTDLRDPRQADVACRGADVVVMAAQVPYPQWHTELLPLFDAALAAAERAGARLVLVDNLYAYGSPGTPITEATPEAATSVKGRLRRDAGRRLLAAHEAGRVPVTIGRFSDYYGPGGTNSLVYQVQIRPALAGKAARAYIDADQPHSFHYLPDAARGFATLAERPEADGRIWVLPSAPALTQRQLIDLVEQAVGHPVKRGHISRPMLRVAGLVDRRLREAYELTDQWDRPYTTDASAFEAAFGPVETTPHATAIRTTVDAFRAAGHPAAA
ncbi:NAD-dependent epimerase/dehydratase family protein [Egicoccus sp. AB-alg2]|uniref:NAD-dependent epimerase/dehydratase family protein n=1 Tax=Egicoccus sp. AB-alg2 TaxID=3242693 RepID=UPI00359D8DC5